MTDKPFAHLHCHSHYSLLDGASSIDRLTDRCKEHGMNALALTDHGNLHGALEFYQKCKKKDINPIIGYEAYIAPGSRFEKDTGSMKESNYHLTLLCQNKTGFKNLIKMASAAYLEGFYFKPRIDKELLERYHEGIVCLSGCVSSEFNRAILRGSSGEQQLDEAVETAKWFQSLLGDRYFIEIMNNGVEVQRLALEGSVEIANRLGIPLVATSDCHYVDRDDSEAQDVMLCINTGKFRTDTGRMRMDGNQYYLRSPAEMYDKFPGLEDAVQRSQEIADGVDIDLELGKRHFPVFDLPEGKTADDHLRDLCIEGLKERYADNPEMYKDGVLADVVLERLDRELGVISRLGFPNYFLIVWDFVRHARELEVPATARGSGVGALVCYALYLSHVCPIKFDLLFERFLDENRLEAPDIDIDFCKERRGDIIRYVKDKYGEENVAQIGTFGTLAARAAIKDVGRALGIPLVRVNQVTAMVPDQLGITLDKALETSDDLSNTYESDPEIRELLDLARKIEGLARNVGTHAAAVVIGDKPLTEYVPLGRVTGKTDIITQWSMNDVEDAGLLKMDFLGLRNLTILRKAVDLIQQTTGEKIDPQKFPLEDKETFALLQRGETKGIFQLESGGIRDLLQRMKPDHFRDIIATSALYRPGPLEGGMVDDYVDVKNGRKEPSYKHPVLKDILEETHGVMVYQEQVMRILNRLGGIPLAKAYTCIKAISKKKESIISANHEAFVEGAVKSGLGKKDAEDIWNLIVKFAGYGFNKCVVAETEVVDAATGEVTSVGELFNTKRPITIHSLDEDGKLRARIVNDVVWNGRKRVFKLTTAQGRELSATGNHPLRVLDGWKHLSELQPGDRIASPRRLTTQASGHWPRHEIILLAGLLAEGNTCHPTCLYFYNNDDRLIADLAEAAEQFPDTTARIDVRGDGRRKEVCLSTGRDTRFQPGQMPWNASSTATAVAPRNKTRCGAYRWADRLGLLGKKAPDKRIPTDCFSLCDEDLELFLGRLWSGDGFVGATGQMPYYATSSPGLARDVQSLLLRLGICAGVHRKEFRYGDKEQPKESTGYTVHLVGQDAVRGFLHRIGPHALGREDQIVAYKAYLDSVAPDRSSKDTVPPEIRQWVNEQRQAAGLGWRELEAESGVCIREFCSPTSRKRGFRRQTIARLADFFASRRLQQVAESDVFWDTVTSVEPAGITDTYDLTVDKTHNFVANGLIVHNSHSTAYALIAYQTAYLKAHYPVEFMAALLTGDIPGRNFTRKDSLVEHLEDCKRMNIEVVPPDVNCSDVEFAVADGKILFGMSAVKGCGGSAAEAIAVEREKNGEFRDLYDFCERVEASACNRSSIETLIKAGAFDSLGARRAQLSAVVERAMQSGASALADKKSGQKNLFGVFEEDEEKAPVADLPDIPEWPEREKLSFEKEVLGFYLTSHPLAEYEKQLRAVCTHTTATIAELPDRADVIMGGMLSSIKLAHTKNGRPGSPTKYANFDLEDLEGNIRSIQWPDDYAKSGDLIQPDAILVVRGILDRRGGGDEANLIANELIPLDQLDSRYTVGVKIRVDESRHSGDTLKQIYEIVRGYPGNNELRLVLDLEEGQSVQVTSHRLKIDVNEEMRNRIDDLLGPGNFQPIAKLPTKSTSGTNGGRGNGRRG